MGTNCCAMMTWRWLDTYKDRSILLFKLEERLSGTNVPVHPAFPDPEIPAAYPYHDYPQNSQVQNLEILRLP